MVVYLVRSYRTYARIRSLTTGTFNLVVKDRIAFPPERRVFSPDGSRTGRIPLSSKPFKAIALARRLYKQAHEAGRHLVAESWQRKIRDFEEEADVLRNSIRRIDEIAALSVRDHGVAKT